MTGNPAVDRLITYLTSLTDDEAVRLVDKTSAAVKTPQWQEATEAAAGADDSPRSPAAVAPITIENAAWERVETSFAHAVASKLRRYTAAQSRASLDAWLPLLAEYGSAGDRLRYWADGLDLSSARDLRVANMEFATFAAEWVVRYAVLAILVRDRLTPAEYDALTDPLTLDDDWYRSVQGRWASGDYDEDRKRLLLAGWEVTGPWPRRLDDPLSVRCVQCDHEQTLVMADMLRSNHAPRCTHPAGGARPLDPEQRRQRTAVRKELRDEVLVDEARAAGWEPAEAPPARETTPWRLTCRTCGETILARVAKREHEGVCPHRLTDAEQVGHDRFVAAGWEPVQHPVRGGTGKRWRIRCPLCGYETSREAIKKIKPCTHPDGPLQA